MKNWQKIAFVTLATILVVISAASGPFKYFSLRIVELHQNSVARSIAAWGDEYSQNQRRRHRAVEMMDYISRYYVTPHPGYRGTKTPEQKLEEQRAETVAKIAAALEKFRSENSPSNTLQILVTK